MTDDRQTRRPNRSNSNGRPGNRKQGNRKPNKGGDKARKTAKKPDPRFAAFRALQDILNNGTLLDEAMEKALSHQAAKTMEGRDRALARLLVSTVLRHGRAFNRIAKEFLDRAIPNKAKDAEILLMMGSAQLLVMKTPPHAAINTIVNIAKANKKTTPFAGMLNAVLRKIAGEVDRWDDMTVARQDVPGWLWTRWTEHRSEDEALALLDACLKEPALDITVKPGKEAYVLDQMDATQLPTGSLRLDQEKLSGPIDQLPGFAEGDWWVQDAASALPVKLLGDLTGKRVLDLCAAPGGKTMQLAAAGASVTAVDISAPRLERIKENLTRTNLSANLVAGDATSYESEDLFDVILLDAPCTATGTLRRHPDKLWHGAIDVESAVTLQDSMLDHALTLLKFDGVLLYCTCSLEPEEGELRVDAFLKRQDNVSLDRIGPETTDGIEKFVSPEGTLRVRPDLWADLGGCDGFFAAQLRKA